MNSIILEVLVGSSSNTPPPLYVVVGTRGEAENPLAMEEIWGIYTVPS